MGFTNFLIGMKRKANGGQHLSQLFNPDPRLAEIVFQAFAWCLEDRGIPLTEDLLEEARREAEKYPRLTINKFIEGIYNRRMQQGFRK